MLKKILDLEEESSMSFKCSQQNPVELNHCANQVPQNLHLFLLEQ